MRTNVDDVRSNEYNDTEALATPILERIVSSHKPVAEAVADERVNWFLAKMPNAYEYLYISAHADVGRDSREHEVFREMLGTYYKCNYNHDLCMFLPKSALDIRGNALYVNTYIRRNPDWISKQYPESIESFFGYNVTESQERNVKNAIGCWRIEAVEAPITKYTTDAIRVAHVWRQTSIMPSEKLEAMWKEIGLSDTDLRLVSEVLLGDSSSSEEHWLLARTLAFIYKIPVSVKNERFSNILQARYAVAALFTQRIAAKKGGQCATSLESESSKMDSSYNSLARELGLSALQLPSVQQAQIVFYPFDFMEGAVARPDPATPEIVYVSISLGTSFNTDQGQEEAKQILLTARHEQWHKQLYRFKNSGQNLSLEEVTFKNGQSNLSYNEVFVSLLTELDFDYVQLNTMYREGANRLRSLLQRIAVSRGADNSDPHAWRTIIAELLKADPQTTDLYAEVKTAYADSVGPSEYTFDQEMFLYCDLVARSSQLRFEGVQAETEEDWRKIGRALGLNDNVLSSIEKLMQPSAHAEDLLSDLLRHPSTVHIKGSVQDLSV